MPAARRSTTAPCRSCFAGNPLRGRDRLTSRRDGRGLGSRGAVLTFQPGQTLAHYRIERLLGEGGMGAVFLAEDTKLHRKVALKILPGEMAANPDRLARFQREAQAVAALNHPHIVTLYSVEEAGGIHFLTMELVEGTSLDHALPPGGLPLAKVFDIGIALADALAAAHERGIVHRDLKPANVMVTKDGRVKVLDFGLAKIAPGSAESGSAAGTSAGSGSDLSSAPTGMMPPLTHAGLVMGTVPYMSPEQVGGEVVDARTDIFSLGVVLYEMATGRRPFRGKNNAETISSILRDAPPPVAELRQDAPQNLGRIIDHCLQKDPEARFQTAKDVRNELRVLGREVESGVAPIGPVTSGTPAPPGATRNSIGGRKGLWIGLGVVTATALAGLYLVRERGQEAPQPAAASVIPAGTPVSTPDPRSIAVLPFVNMSSDKEQEYFSDGISEELLNLLAKVRELKVAARTSSFSFKGKGVEIREIARQLNVAHVLEGSVRRSGEQVRITAQLIHAADGFHLWSQTWDRRHDDIFKIQDEIAADVVKELQVKLLGAAPRVRRTDPEAYALYLQAVQLGRQNTPEAFAKSDALYRQVLGIDPRYAPAWAELARNSTNQASYGLLSGKQAYPRAQEEAMKALAIDPEYAPAHASLGFFAMVRDDLAGAARHLERALTLDPTDVRVLSAASTFIYALGRLEEALPLEEAIVRRDPVNVAAHYGLGLTRVYSGRYEEAIASFQTVLSLSPGRGGAHYALSTALLLKGDAPAALREAEQETDEFWRMVALALAYHRLGRNADSDAVLAALIAQNEKDAPYNIASVYAFRGEADKAFEWLDKAIEDEDAGLAEIVVQGVWFANIHSDPRWRPFLRKVGKAPEQIAKIEFKVTLPD